MSLGWRRKLFSDHALCLYNLNLNFAYMENTMALRIIGAALNSTSYFRKA